MRLSSRKAARGLLIPPSYTGNPGSSWATLSRPSGTQLRPVICYEICEKFRLSGCSGRGQNLCYVHPLRRIVAGVAGCAVVIALAPVTSLLQPFQRKIAERIGFDELANLFH